jgi:hypothetical protein
VAVVLGGQGAGRRAVGVNLCRSCGEDFGSVALFDAHRVGRHAYTLSEGLKPGVPFEDGRRCLCVEEMQERGWALGARGRWVDPSKSYEGLKSRKVKRAEAVTAVAQDEGGEELAA